MIIASRRCVVVIAGLTALAIAAGCTGDDDDGSALQSLAFEATDDTAPPGSGGGTNSTTSALAAPTHLGSYTVTDDEFDTEVTVTVGQGLRIIETNAIPDHQTGSFPNAGNPNTISGQVLRYEFSTNPRNLGRATPARVPGVAVNGIPFEPGTAEVIECQSGERYQIEAIQGVYDLGLDGNNAHVQPSGLYHYHGLAEPLAQSADGDRDGSRLAHVGFAADGFLLFVSEDGAHRPSYRLSTDQRTGTGCSYRGQEVPVEGTDPDGTYVSDWVNDPSVGDLDACNGVTVDGEYLYLVTEDYPYLPRCLMGDFTDPVGPGADRGGGGAGQTGSGAGGATGPSEGG